MAWRTHAALVDDYLACAKDVLEEITSGPDQRPARPRVPVDTIADALTAIFQSVAIKRFAPTRTLELLPPSDGVLAAVAALPKNSAFVIRRRYGLESFTPMTLNEIALQAAVSRERVRQVEAKSLKRLHEGAGAVFTRLLDENAEGMWQVLSGGRRVITSVSISANRGRLEPLHRLAMDVVFGGMEAWAASRGVGTDDGWSRVDVELPSEVVERVKAALTELALPRPLADISDACSVSSEVTAAVLAESRQTKCLDGFVHAGFVGARARRAAMLYRLATQGDSAPLFDIQTLAQMHRSACPDDVVASRMVLKEVQEQPHLFVRALDSLWLSLPLGGERTLGAVSTLPFEHSHVLDDGGFDDGAIGRALVQCLRDSGPRRLADLRDLVLASGDGSIRSVGPILLANPCFQRVLPGTYGLYCEYSEAQIDAASFGVPQNRRRLFIIGDREDKPPKIESPGTEPPSVADILDPPGTWRCKPVSIPKRASATLERVKRGMTALGEGVDFLVVYYSSDRAGGWQPLNRPLRTMTTLDRFGLVQWIDGEPMFRMLQVPELQRAMGFPKAFRLRHGTRRDKIRLLGNGVCAPVMQHVLTALIKNPSPVNQRGLDRSGAPIESRLRPAPGQVAWAKGARLIRPRRVAL